jgi:1,6-anhydro-N-acetylmuramate kinase
VARQAGIAIETVDMIASHGQTVYHQVAASAERSTSSCWRAGSNTLLSAAAALDRPRAFWFHTGARLCRTGSSARAGHAVYSGNAHSLAARSIAESYRRYCRRVDEVLLSGGGACNSTLVRMIQAALHEATVRPVDEVLLDADAKEAIACAVAGYATLHGWPNNVPAATGAAHPVVLGSLTPGANYRIARSTNISPF